MATVKFIGRTTSFKGKRLFDILCRLKDFGVGRVVYRNKFFERYPEPSYYVITKVDPDMSDPTQVSDIWGFSYLGIGLTCVKLVTVCDWNQVRCYSTNC